MLQYVIAILSIVIIIILVILSLLDRTKRVRRAERFSMDNTLNCDGLSAHAKEIAQSIRITNYKRSHYSPSFNRRGFSEIYERLKNTKTEFSTAEWLIDNFYQIINQITELSNLHFYNMPYITRGVGSGNIRALWLAYELVAHSDCSVDVDKIKTFLISYSEQSPLYMRELRA